MIALGLSYMKATIHDSRLIPLCDHNADGKEGACFGPVIDAFFYKRVRLYEMQSPPPFPFGSLDVVEWPRASFSPPFLAFLLGRRGRKMMGGISVCPCLLISLLITCNPHKFGSLFCVPKFGGVCWVSLPFLLPSLQFHGIGMCTPSAN